MAANLLLSGAVSSTSAALQIQVTDMWATMKASRSSCGGQSVLSVNSGLPVWQASLALDSLLLAFSFVAMHYSTQKPL